MMHNHYLELKERQQKEVNNLPLKFAFSKEQFAEAMSELGLTPDDTDKVCKCYVGGFCLKTDLKKIMQTFARLNQEFKDAIAEDKTGDNFIFEMFIAELSNHEYIITEDVTDTLQALDLTQEDLDANPALQHGLEKACAWQIAHQIE